jgi:archaellum biogenesis protein FlaJ (TadC family)
MLVRDRNQKEELIKEILNKQEKMKKNNPWISGSFYLVVAVVIIASLGVLSNIVYWSVFPIIIVAGILVIALVGILQLKNDEKISDKSFTSLIKETYKRLPLIGKHKK